MACCGQKRQALSAFGATMGSEFGSGKSQRLGGLLGIGFSKHKNLETKLSVEYLGNEPFTFIGTLTGRKYFFTGWGSKQSIDARDENELDQMPLLRKLRK